MTEEEYEHWEQMCLDNYMVEKVYSMPEYSTWDEMPTLGDWLDA